MDKVQRVGLVPHRTRLDAQRLAERAASWLTSRDVSVRIPRSDAAEGAFSEYLIDDDKFAAACDVVVSVGGDGTMLRAASLSFSGSLPLLGINAGRLGYLAEVEPENLDESLGRLIAGDYEIDERTVLAVTVNSSGPANGTWWALNEAVLEKEAPGRLVHIGIEINKAFFTTYAADGVVIATSTGSTAYSFSAGGPIAFPQHQCILLTPVSPHMLFDRSLILGTQEEIKCTITDDRGVVIITDGREIGRLTMGDSVVCTGADKPVRMITLGTRDFHQILKAKFGLADR